MREILFRGKRKDNGEWVYGWYSCITKGAHCDPIKNACYITTFSKLDNGEIILTKMFEVNAETIGQYTGRVDCNNVKIFEGDIVLYNEETGTIFFDDGAFAVDFGIWSVRIWSVLICDVYDNDLEVIGNIHDNPELMEV